MGFEEGGKMTKEMFLFKYPFCYRCRVNENKSLPSTHAIRDLKGFYIPVCDKHYREFCVGFGNMLLMRDLMGGGKRYGNHI